MLKIFTFPFAIVKFLFTGLGLLINVLYLFAKGMERVAADLERETASLAARAHKERETKAQEEREMQVRIDRAIQRNKRNRELLANEESQPQPTAGSRASIETPVQTAGPVQTELRSSAPTRAVSEASYPLPSTSVLATKVELQNNPELISLLLFDLDGTLLDTDDLEQFRGRQNIGQQSAEYAIALTEAYVRSSSRNIYHARHLHELLASWPRLKIGVFTRSPRAYANVLLNAGFPGLKWDTVVAFEDVVQTKPHGEGVEKAMRATGISDPRQVVLVGDDTADVQAAYNAGCVSLLETASWSRPNWRALEKIPDGILRGPATLAKAVGAPAKFLPALEQALIACPVESRHLRFDAVPHFGPSGEKLDIFVLGRLFTESTELANRSRWHGLTKSILDNKSSAEFPPAWSFTIWAFLQKQLEYHNQLVITVIPAKNGRVPRMENLLAQLRREMPTAVSTRCIFVQDLLRYAPSAESHSARHLDRAERMENARANLSLGRSEVAVKCHVVVIDDVVTSGATLIHAHRRLLDGGARSVTCVALAKAVRFS